MEIPILFEDETILAINKPAGLLVHPLSLQASVGARPIPGGERETLIDWLMERYPDFDKQNWPDSGRPGIVHRLDRDTSGVLLIAKTPEALSALQKQFAERTTHKKYQALVAGNPDWEEQTVRAAVERGEGTERRAHYFQVPGSQGKKAETHFRVMERFTHDSAASMVEAEPKTGRTHQIRVHLGLLGFPILGDPWYDTKLSRDLTKQLVVPRLMLHALELTFTHPARGEKQTVKAPLPTDFQAILDKIEDMSRRSDDVGIPTEASGKPKIIVLSGPGGVGKTTVQEGLLTTDLPGLTTIVPWTTRVQRANEVEGKDWVFFTKEMFEAKIAAGELLEYTQFNGQYYGTPKASIEDALSHKQSPVLVLDVVGAKTIREKYPDNALLIFLTAPKETLLARYTNRGQSREEAEKRLKIAEELELPARAWYDAVVENAENHAKETITTIANLIRTE